MRYGSIAELATIPKLSEDLLPLRSAADIGAVRCRWTTSQPIERRARRFTAIMRRSRQNSGRLHYRALWDCGLADLIRDDFYLLALPRRGRR
jgi:hypothetical protein